MNRFMFMVTLSVVDVDHYKKGVVKGQVTALNHHPRRVHLMSVAKSILTMTYQKTGSLPRRVRAVANTPRGDKVRSLIIDPSQYDVYQTIEEIHALAAWQLATQLAWLYGEEGDLIPAKLHRVGITGQGEDVTLWILKENITAKQILAGGLAKFVKPVHEALKLST